jgi:hypothetical protein
VQEHKQQLLGFGGYHHQELANSSNSTEEYDGTAWTNGGGNFNTARSIFSWSRYTNSSFISRWRDSSNSYYHLQQKNMMVQLGHQVEICQQVRKYYMQEQEFKQLH